MHRDKKIGFGLAILLIGIVAALFFRNENGFRNETDSSDGLPQLEDPQQLDGIIAEKSLIPYLTGIETDDPSPRNETRDSEWGMRSGERGMVPSNSELRNPRSGHVETLSESTGGPPDPIRTPQKSRSRRAANRPTPQHNNAWKVSRETRLQNTEFGMRSSEPEFDSAFPTPHSPLRRFRVYRVQRGDTLSGLADRFLGSGRRFHDIFSANRDVLQEPNDLRAGMTIRIPLPQPLSPQRANGVLDADRRENSPVHNALKSKIPAETGKTKAIKPDIRPQPAATGRPVRRFRPARTPFFKGRFDNRSSQVGTMTTESH